MTNPGPGWYFTEDVDQFLDRAGDFLGSRPAPHTVALTVTRTLRSRGTHLYGDGVPLFGVLERDGAVHATLFRTPPHRLNLTALTAGEAGVLADRLAERLADRGEELPGVSAERETAAAFARAWRRRTGADPTLTARHRLYRLAEPTAPRPAPPGRPRVAVASDRAQLMRWYTEFGQAMGGGGLLDPGGWADARIAYGGVTLWETPDGTPVSMAAVSVKVADQVRVAPVYTPEGLRGRGYAGAVTAEVGRAALAAGAAEVVLFADLANPTSNGLYQRIGYRPVADFHEYGFAPPQR